MLKKVIRMLRVETQKQQMNIILDDSKQTHTHTENFDRLWTLEGKETLKHWHYVRPCGHDDANVFNCAGSISN